MRAINETVCLFSDNDGVIDIKKEKPDVTESSQTPEKYAKY